MDIEDTDREAFFIWSRTRQLAVVQALCHVVYWYIRRKHRLINNIERPLKSQLMDREKVRVELVTQLQTNKKCRDVIRMGSQAFEELCNILKNDGGLRQTKRVSVEEQVAKFLHILAHNVKNRNVSFFFRRSGETVSRHFHRCLRAVISLEDKFLRQPDGSQVPGEIQNSNRFFPYFKDCVGALDGTHVRVKVSNKDAPRYRGRKGYPTQNVLAACTFDLRFTILELNHNAALQHTSSLPANLKE